MLSTQNITIDISGFKGKNTIRKPNKQAVTVIAWFFCNKCIVPRNIQPIGKAKPPVTAIHEPQLASRALPPLNYKNGDHACPTIGADAKNTSSIWDKGSPC